MEFDSAESLKDFKKTIEEIDPEEFSTPKELLEHILLQLDSQIGAEENGRL